MLRVALIVVAIAIALAALAVVLHDDPPPDASHAVLSALTTVRMSLTSPHRHAAGGGPP